MITEKKHWIQNWFNEDYLKLYSHRNQEEADRQVDFIIRGLHLTGRERILDIGCGAGRHSVAFGQRGYSVVGVDSSEFLIEKANQKLEERHNLPVRFVLGDMYKLVNVGMFDLVINMFTSFGYFSGDDENARIFGAVRHHLSKGGDFFLDYLHPYQVRKNFVPVQEIEVDGEQVRIEKEIKDDRVIKTIRFPGRTYQEKVKLYDREQIEDMLRKYRFQVMEVWNDYEGNDWCEEGERQLFHCRSI